MTSLSSLIAGNVAATGGISKLLREKEFTGQFHEGEKTNVHISLVGGRAILVVLFDRASVARPGASAGEEGLRRDGQASSSSVAKKAAARSRHRSSPRSPTSDIDNLFKDLTPG